MFSYHVLDVWPSMMRMKQTSNRKTKFKTHAIGLHYSKKQENPTSQEMLPSRLEATYGKTVQQ